jgi:methionyl aminopeptidase
MTKARAGEPLRNIGRAVERRARQCGFQVIRNLCGHGVGRYIHEEPSVPNTFEHTLIVTGGRPIVVTRQTLTPAI